MSASLVLGAAAVFLFAASPEKQDFRFVILGDRTGGAQPGVFEEATREAAAASPDFVITVGDMIEGGRDDVVDSEWKSVLDSIAPAAKRLTLFVAPGNHDVWSDTSARAFEQYTKHPLHYSFDFRQAHFTVLDNSKAEQFSNAEMAYLERDLAEHSAQPLKFVFSHRPSWILQALLGDRKSRFQQLAERYHVQYFVAGHIHQMLYFRVNAVNYMCMPSAGGHLRDTKKYESGWFFAETEVAVHGTEAKFAIHELQAPFGEGRRSELENWGATGLVRPSVAMSRKTNE